MNQQENNDNNTNRQTEKTFDQSFWNSRWENSETGWDIGYASPAITNYIDQYMDKNSAILIPGCGNAYEAEYLVKAGFTNITLLDISPKAVSLLKEKFIQSARVKILCEDFFTHKGAYDLIIEQTFFCANHPDRRNEYAEKAASLLKSKGRIAGLMFDTVFEKQGPPFGGNAEEYNSVFDPFFEIKIMEKCYNSITPRAGSELFVVMIKK